MPPPSLVSEDPDSLERQTIKTASLLDNGFQAQVLAELAQGIKAGFSGNQAGNVPFFFAQSLASGIIFFQPHLSVKLKLLHLVLALYSITRIILSLYLFFSSEICAPNPTTELCKVDYSLDLFFKGFLLFVSIATKAVKYNEKRIELQRTVSATTLTTSALGRVPLDSTMREPASPPLVLRLPNNMHAPFDENSQGTSTDTILSTVDRSQTIERSQTIDHIQRPYDILHA